MNGNYPTMEGGKVSESEPVPAQGSDSSSELDPKDKELFLKAWGFREGEISDAEILMAIEMGHL
jgi:hypothetical protein